MYQSPDVLLTANAHASVVLTGEIVVSVGKLQLHDSTEISPSDSTGQSTKL